MKKEYIVLSPDGITIDHNTYPSFKEAYKAFEAWRKRYERQGYYSSNFERIPLDELDRYIQIIELNN